MGMRREARTTAWWWTQAHLLYRRIKNILEAAASDVDQLPAPKAYWFDDDLLKEWFDDRRAEQKRRAEEDSV